ncbi:hypothetical protein D3C85_1718940 [compost metagenome]
MIFERAVPFFIKAIDGLLIVTDGKVGIGGSRRAYHLGVGPAISFVHGHFDRQIRSITRVIRVAKQESVGIVVMLIGKS